MRYRKVDVKLWIDEKFRMLSPLIPSGQALFIYLLTNPNTTVIPGLYRAGAGAIADELGWGKEALIEVIDELTSLGLLKIDLKAHVIFIPNAIKYNKPQSPNVIKSWSMHWDEIPECNLKNLAYEVLKAFIDTMGKAYTKAFRETINKSYVNTLLNQEQEEEQNISSLQEDVEFNANLMLQPTTSIIPNCPHNEIIALYHDILPGHPKVLIWNKTRQSHLQQRWRENKKHQDIDEWKKFFEYVKESDFLTGKIAGKDGNPPFIATLDWLIKPNNFAKVIEGKYHGRQP